MTLLKDDSGFEGDAELLCDFRLLPKKLSTDKKPDSNENGHVHFPKPERAGSLLIGKSQMIQWQSFREVGKS